MAVRKKAKHDPKGIFSDKTLNAIGEKLTGLLRTHENAIASILEDSESRELNVACGIAIDLGESEPSVDVKIRYTQTNTDHAVIPLVRPDNPSEPWLIPRGEDEPAPGEPIEAYPPDENFAEVMPKARRGRRKKGGDDETQSEG